MKDHPPKLVDRIFQFFCGKACSDDLLGDLYELYYYQRERKGRFRSALFYWYQAIRLLFSYAIVKRKRESAYSNHYQDQNNIMLFNYIKISVRNILKNRTFTVLNVFGLALGMSIGLLALAFYVELYQFDRFHNESNKIYRLTTQITENGSKRNISSAPPALSYLVQEQLSSIEASVHLNDQFYPSVITTGDPIRLNGYFTQPAFLELFDFPLAFGSKDVLERPGMVILTHEAAQKLYEDPTTALGQILETKNWGKLQVGGILKPFPKNTHFAFDLLTGFSSNHGLNLSNEANWTDFSRNYFYLKSDLAPTQVEAQLAILSNPGKAFFDEQNLEVSYALQSILEINPGSGQNDPLGYIFDRWAIFAFFGMTLLILIPACLNYSNMAVANALKRSKEIGIRKIMGSSNKQIINQFLVETVIVCLAALVLSIFMFNYIRIELLKMLIGGSAMSFDLTPKLLAIFILFAVITGILTGLFPSLYFSRVTPIKAIRNAVNNQNISISGLRKGLMTFQFVLSLVFMIGIGVLLKQYRVTINYDQGFAKENVLVLPIKPDSQQLIDNTFNTAPGITEISYTSSIPGTPLGSSLYFYNANHLDSIKTSVIYVDEHFVEHMKIGMKWGDPQLMESGFERVLVNEQLMTRLQNIDGQSTDSLVAEMANGKKVLISGVVEDYNQEPLNKHISPMVIRLEKSELKYALLTVNTDNILSTISGLEERWEGIFPDTPFKATFLDHEIENAYYYFLTGMKIFAFLAILAVTISCLGLLGMVIFSTENRKKEVAIRKVLGAGAYRLLYSLSGIYFRMWAIALTIAIPLSYIYYDKVMLRIYNKFSGGVGFSEVALSCLLTLVLGMLAIMVQSARVMRTNPADNLRNE